MQEWKSQNHVKWDCKYDNMFVPKYRRKVLYGNLRGKVGTILRELCEQKGGEIVRRESDGGSHSPLLEHSAQV